MKVSLGISTTGQGAGDMNLAVFDIDGTLLHSTAADDAAYAASMKEILGIEISNTDWSQYNHSTDSGLTHEIASAALQRDPTVAEIEKIRAGFCRRLKAGHEEQPSCLEPVAGSSAFLRLLESRPDWRIAVATGSWSATAELKLACACVDLANYPMATADFAHSRVDILRHAIVKARQHYRVEWQRIAYVGDGVWDCRAAREISIGFLGVGRGEKAERLRREGAEEIIADFRDATAVLQALERIAR